MTKRNLRKINIYFIISLTYFIFISTLVYFFYIDEETNKKEITNQELMKSSLEFKSVLEDFEHTIISELTIKIIQENSLVDFLKSADHAKNESELKSIRQDLKENFLDIFNNLKQSGIDVLHFHLPNSKSLLRMHNPKDFGDDLSSFRKSVNMAQESRNYIYGYEVGIFNGAFRNVIPFFEKGKLIGSAEVSFSEKEIMNKLKQSSMHSDYNFILDRNTVVNVLRDTSKYVDSSIDSNYLVIQEDGQKEINSYMSQFVGNDLKKAKNFIKTIKYKNEYYLISFISVKDVSGKHIGYFVKYKKAKIIENIKDDTIVKILLSTIFVSIIYILIIQNTVSRKKERFQKNYLDAIFHTQENIIVITEGTKISDGNQPFLRFFGFSSIEEFREKHDCICEFMEKIDHREYIYKNKFGNNWIDTVRQNPEIDWKTEIIREERRHVFSIKVTYMDFDNRKRSIVSFADSTSMIEHQENLESEIEKRIGEITIQKNQLEQYKKLVDENVITSSTDTRGYITEVSKAFEKISGYSKEELIGTNHNIVRHPDVPKDVYSDMWKTIESGKVWKGEIKNLDSNGEDYWVAASVYPKFDTKDKEKIIGYTAIRQDITDQKKVEELSIRDSLTGLYNRRYFEEIFASEIEKATLNLQSFAFLIADVDNFKKYNDNYGHQNGDEVLRNVASVFENSFRCSNCYTFRLGGEEFGVILRGFSKVQLSKLVEQARQNLVNRDIEHKYNEKFGKITSSFGLAFREIMTDELSGIEIYRIADQGLYLAKSSGRNRVELLEL
ncbi:PAS domain S-box/diguanylate cyclase (GGDEF) domain-containing protein [Thiovulum sp. ES]|nr:PAS domain S-box/diguanylate cyclase (GGDEF) domain-containing protein [Thiovulum sp. ES]